MYRAISRQVTSVASVIYLLLCQLRQAVRDSDLLSDLDSLPLKVYRRVTLTGNLLQVNFKVNIVSFGLRQTGR